jgi:hypothetical protein
MSIFAKTSTRMLPEVCLHPFLISDRPIPKLTQIQPAEEWPRAGRTGGPSVFLVVNSFGRVA